MGEDAFNKIHKNIYSGEFARYLRKDIPFAPHIAVGHFARRGQSYDLKDPSAAGLDEVAYQAAIKDLHSADLNLDYLATKLELIGVDDEFKKSWTIDEFRLGKNRRGL